MSNRTQTIDLIKSKLDTMSDEQLDALADMAQALSRNSVYSILSDADKTAIETALDELDRGAGVAWSSVRDELKDKIRSAAR